jgi:hypothetical protein
MRKAKIEYIPMKLVKIMEKELKKMEREKKTLREPMRIEAWQRLADKLTRGMFKKK